MPKPGDGRKLGWGRMWWVVVYLRNSIDSGLVDPWPGVTVIVLEHFGDEALFADCFWR